MKEKEIGDLYPGLSDEEQKIAVENLDQYLELSWEFWEEHQSHFDGNSRELYDQGKVDSPKN
jgi:hypothetical protein